MDTTLAVEVLVTMFVIMDPVGNVPIFLAVTRRLDQRARNRAALLAVLTAALVIVVFALVGRQVLAYLSVSVPALQGAGGVLLLLVALDLLPSEVQAAITDAATRFDVPESEVAVAGALKVVWSDGSLGCPEDGMMYTQALIDGYRLTLEVKGQRIEYHGADGQPPSLCED